MYTTEHLKIVEKNHLDHFTYLLLMKTVKDNDCWFVTLSASSDSGYRIYERLGFHKIGEFGCFEYKGT